MNKLKEFIRKFWIWLIFILILLLGGGGFFILNKKSQVDSAVANQPLGIFDQDGQILSNRKCQGNEKPKITHLPMNYDDFSIILPYGMVTGNHVTPIDHQYFSPTVFRSKPDTYPVYAMADAQLVGIEKRTNSKAIRMVFSMSCKLFYYYDLVTSLTPEIEKETGGKEYASTNIDVKAGQQIGWIGGQTLDFAVWDMDVKLDFVRPESYVGERWKIHTADPLLYYSDELKTKILSKYVRSTEPVSGKIDYDIDGKLIGNWFLEGTGGYMGGSKDKYWKSHLSIAPDFIDPSSIVFSFGDFAGEEKQFGAKGNKPDPITVGVETGLVKYELVQKEWAKEDGSRWDSMSFAKGLRAMNNERFVQGTVLVQMLEKRKLKMEVFPGKTVGQVAGFTANAKIYER